MEDIKLYLDGLDCANCAAKIEDKVNKLDEVEEASLNFSSGTLTILPKDIESRESIIDKARDIVIKLEPHVKVIHEERKKQPASVCEDECCNDTHEHSHSHEGDHDHNEDNHNHSHDHGGFNKKEIITFTIGIAFYALALFLKDRTNYEIIPFIISYLIVGGEVILSALRNIKRGEIFDENFLMAIATIGAFAVGEYPEAVAVMIFYGIGEMFQGYAVNKSRKSISSLMDIRPDYANLIINDVEKRVSPEEVKINDIILVKPGEKIPLDGIVIDGEAAIDTAALTGEALPREVYKGSEVLSGSINKNSPIKIQVTKSFGESTVSKILQLVENAGSKKAKTEKFITKFAKYYTPVVVFSAVAIAVVPPIMGFGEFSGWLYRALIFLVVSCPCALVVSIPLGFFGGIGAASKKGILIKGGNYLEALKSVDKVVFDKTGTLTKGIFKVTSVVPSEGFSESELLECAAYAESYSNHPIGESIRRAYNKDINKNLIKDYKEIAGKGISVTIEDRKILAGNNRLIEENNITLPKINLVGTIINIAIDKEYMGYILISDEIKDDAKKAIIELKANGVKNTIMLTGDNREAAEYVGKELDIDNIYSQLLPHNKVEKVEELLNENKNGGNVIFVGDGINDAPVLARADIGIAMGGVGSDAAIEAADIVIMTDEPSKIAEAIKISKKTSSIVTQNIIFALGVKVLVMILATIGLGNMWEAVFADVGVTLIAVLNTMRILKMK